MLLFFPLLYLKLSLSVAFTPHLKSSQAISPTLTSSQVSVSILHCFRSLFHHLLGCFSSQSYYLVLLTTTLPPNILFADCTELYKNTPSIPKAKGGLLYPLSSWAYTRIWSAMDQQLKIDNNKECVSSRTRVGLTVNRNIIIMKRRCNMV